MNVRVLPLTLLVGTLSAAPAIPVPVAPTPPDRDGLFSPRESDAEGPHGVSRRDRHFVEDVLKIIHNETVIARLVAERAITRDVSALARQLVSDLDAASEELRTLSKRKNIPFPAPRSEAGDLKTWNEKDPKSLDADYLKRVKDVLDELAKLYEKAAADSDDPEIAAFARKLHAAVVAQRKRAETTNPDPAAQPPPPAPAPEDSPRRN